MEKLSIVVDYIEGRIEPAIFEQMLCKDTELYNFLQALVPADKEIKIFNAILQKPVAEPYTIKGVLRKYEALDQGGPKGTPEYHYYIHREIADLVMVAFPNMQITPDDRPKQLKCLAMEACPEYIDGKEVAENNIIGKILSDIPQELSKTKKLQEAKARIKAAFHIEGRNYPRWIQPPEWPVNNGIPMKYVKTVKINSEHVQHHFEDINSGEIRVVDDFF